jgi:hypothetical protein
VRGFWERGTDKSRRGPYHRGPAQAMNYTDFDGSISLVQLGVGFTWH